MATRRFDFITGIESSSAPVATDPVNPSDPTTLGFSDGRYVQGGPGVADVAALKALDVSLRRDRDCILVESKNALYRYDATGTGTNDDNLIIAPTAGAGRWFKLSDFASATGNLDVPGDFQALGDQFYVAGDSQFIGTTSFAQAATFANDPLYIQEEGGTPTTPTSGYWGLYPTATGFKQIDDTGAISDLGGGGGGSGSGELNLVSSGSSSADGWSTSVGGLTVSTNTDAANLPLEGLVASSLYIRAGSSGGSGNNINFKFSMPDALLNTKLKIEWYQKARSAYASGDLKVELWTNTLSDYTGTYVEVPLSTDASGDTLIPALQGKFTGYFDAAGLVYYELRMVKNNADSGGSTDGVDFSNIIVGPGIQPQGAVVTEWQSFSPQPSSSPWTNTTYTGQWRRVGSNLEIVASALMTGTPTGGGMIFQLPAGLTIDSNVVVPDSNATVLGYGSLLDAGVDRYTINARWFSSNTIGMYYQRDEAHTPDRNVTPTLPISLVATDRITAYATMPIAEWAGSGTVNLGQNDVEYAFNTSSSTTATDVTSFGFGPQGTPIRAITASLRRRVRFTSPIQPTDRLVLEISDDRMRWIEVGGQIDANNVDKLRNDGTNSIGAGIDTSTGAGATGTDVDVRFGLYRTGTNTAWGATVGGYYWRVRKEAAGTAVGFGAGSAEAKGLVYAPVAITGQFQTGIANNTEVNIGSETLTLPAGQYLVNFGAQPSVTFSATPTFARMQLKVTDSSNVQLAGLINIGVGALSASTELNGTHASTQLVTLSAPTTVKIRGLINVSGGTVSSRDFFGAYAMFTRIA